MEKQLKDYLHFYLQSKLKCKAMGYDEQVFEMTGISYDDTQNIWWVYFENEEIGHAVLSDVFPILRCVESITESEAHDIWLSATGMEYVFNNRERIINSVHTIKAITPLFVILLLNNFDLFGLIEAGLALDATKLPVENI